MATYKDIKRQIAELEKQAEELRKSEATRIIAGIKTQIIKYDLTPADLFDVGTDATIRPVAAIPEKPPIGAKKTLSEDVVEAPKPASVPKYMDPKTLKTWTGHGKAPSWIAAAASKGKKDDFLIAKVEKLQAENNAKAAEGLSAAAVKKAAIAAKPVIKAPAASTRKPVKPASKKKVPGQKKSVVKPKASIAKQAVAVPEPVAVEPVPPTPAPEAVVAPEVNETV